ncbi:hypothetical protein BTH160X_250004 [Brochothrix thermosphacta]|nr:hypothetical protein BTH160X_250004 [Brochothrix thermosphacta]
MEMNVRIGPNKNDICVNKYNNNAIAKISTVQKNNLEFLNTRFPPYNVRLSLLYQRL